MYCEPSVTAGSVKKLLTSREVACVTVPDKLTPLGGSTSYEIKRRLLKDPSAVPVNETGILTEPPGLSRGDLNPLAANGGVTCSPPPPMFVVPLLVTITVRLGGAPRGRLGAPKTETRALAHGVWLR